MVTALPKPVLLEPVQTGSYVLVPLTSKYSIWKVKRQIIADKELLGLLTQRQKPSSAWKLWKEIRRPNHRRRFHHAIVDRASGRTIGYHYINLLAYRRATLEVVIFDRQFWGKGVVIEVRKPLLLALYDQAGVRCFTSNVHSRNFASILNYKKLGFEHAGTIFSGGFDELRKEPADTLLMTLHDGKLEQKIQEWRHEITA